MPTGKIRRIFLLAIMNIDAVVCVGKIEMIKIRHARLTQYNLDALVCDLRSHLICLQT